MNAKHCQNCNRLFVVKGMRYCKPCSSSMTLEQKIQAQREYKAKVAAKMAALSYEVQS